EGEGEGEGAITHTVTSTDGSMDFSPADLVISVGDTVRFEMSATHNAVEVSEATYDSRGTDALEGGFYVDFGQTGEVLFEEPGVHYYVCTPHVRIDMIGTITVE
ncbi:MAG TPA: halocyanin, partial [Deltaproteobacteria bacterium]|nr:halocyanin [Deltaproteobacteria bacterium]